MYQHLKVENFKVETYTSKMDMEVDINLFNQSRLHEVIHSEVNLPSVMTVDNNGSPSADGSFGGQSQRFDIHDMFNSAHTPTLVTVFIVIIMIGLGCCCCTGCGLSAWLIVKRQINRQARTVHTAVTNTAGALIRTYKGRKPEEETSPWGTSPMQMQQLLQQ